MYILVKYNEFKTQLAIKNRHICVLCANMLIFIEWPANYV